MFRFFSSKFVVRASRTQSNLPWRFQLSQLSTKCLGPSKPLQILGEKRLFRVNYLVQKCGFSPEKAASVSRWFKFETPEQPDSVLLFLKNLRFSEAQVSKVLNIVPTVLDLDPEKALLPKVRFFRDLGLSADDISGILIKAPNILKRDLEGHLIPSVEYLKGFITLDERVVDCLRRFPTILRVDLTTSLIPNITMFRNLGVDDAHIQYLLINQPRFFLSNRAKLKSAVERVKEIGLVSCGMKFMLAVHVLRSMSGPIWDSKVKMYQDWGWSEEEILQAFRKQPWFMSPSEDKITGMMDFLVNQMGLDRSLVMLKPEIITMSLEKRIKPRCMFYKAMSEKGLFKKKFSFANMLLVPEKMFLKRFVECYKDKAPEMLKIYEETMALSK